MSQVFQTHARMSTGAKTFEQPCRWVIDIGHSLQPGQEQALRRTFRADGVVCSLGLDGTSSLLIFN